MKCIGIDIGSFSVKVFEIETSPKGTQLLGYQEHPLSTQETADNRVAIIDILKSLAEKNEGSSTKYVFCLPQGKVSSRYKSFPFKQRSKVLQTVPFELEDELPFDIEESSFDAKFVHFQGGSSDVIASATPNKNILDLLELTQSVGIDPDIISVEGVAIANLVEDFISAPPTLPVQKNNSEEGEAPETKEGHLILSMGHNSTTISVFKEYRLVSVHSLDWGGIDIAHAISQRYRISLEEAFKEVQTKSFILTNKEGANRDQVIFSDTISNSLKPLIRDLNLYLADLQNEFHIQFSHISLTGGASQVRNLNNFLTQTLSIPVRELDLFENFGQSNISNQVELTPVIQASAALSLSLALEGSKRPINPATNFRKDLFVKKSQALQLFWQKWAPTARLLAIAIALFYVYAFAKSFYADSINQQANANLKKQAKASGLSGSNARKSGLRRYVRNKKREIKNRKTLSQVTKMTTALDIINQLSQKVPSKSQVSLNIRRFEITGGRMNLQGTVASAQQIPILENTLKSLSKNKSVTRRKSAPSPDTSKISFSYDLLLDRNIGKPSRKRAKK